MSSSNNIKNKNNITIFVISWNKCINYLIFELVDLLGAAANEQPAVDEPQPNRGNKTSKKNKKKNKNQDWDNEEEGMVYIFAGRYILIHAWLLALIVFL